MVNSPIFLLKASSPFSCFISPPLCSCLSLCPESSGVEQQNPRLLGTIMYLSLYAEKPVSLELSCGAGPIHMVLDPGQFLLLDCHPRAIDTPLNVTWLHDGAPVLDSEAAWTLPNGSLVVHPSSKEASEGRMFHDVEGGYSCISSSPYGTLASDTITLQLSSKS